MPDTEEKQRILQHRHCLRCGKAFTGPGVKERYCSQECFESDGSDAKAKLKKYAVIMVALWAVVIVAVFLVGF